MLVTATFSIMLVIVQNSMGRTWRELQIGKTHNFQVTTLKHQPCLSLSVVRNHLFFLCGDQHRISVFKQASCCVNSDINSSRLLNFFLFDVVRVSGDVRNL